MTPRGGDEASSLPVGFRRGFRNRNPLVLVAAGLLLLPVVLGLNAFFAQGYWTAAPLKHLLVKQSDDFTWVSWSVGRVKRDPPDGPAVYLLGGSSARESIPSGSSLAEEVERLSGRRIDAVNLGSMNQNFAQSLAVIDNVPDTPATVLVGINAIRFTRPDWDNQRQAEGKPILLASSFLREYVSSTYGKQKYAYTIIPGIFTYLTTYLQDHKSELLSGQIPEREYGHHRYHVWQTKSVKRKEQMVRQFNAKWQPVLPENLQYNLAMLDQLLIEARKRGIRVILLELPTNRAIIGHDFDWARKQYVPPVRALAAKYDVPYVDFNPELHLKNSDFYDLSHLVEPGRVIWQKRLAEELVKRMDMGDGTSAPTPAPTATPGS